MFPIVRPCPLNGPAAYVCAQSGCRACLDHLMSQHARLVHFVLRRQYRGVLAYEDLLQEGRIALWQAVLHFDPHRGIAFSTYAGVVIERRTAAFLQQLGPAPLRPREYRPGLAPGPLAELDLVRPGHRTSFPGAWLGLLSPPGVRPRRHSG
jgi:hypothetical protein